MQVTPPTKEIENPNSAIITASFYSHYETRYELCANNIFLGDTGYEMDFFGVRRSGYCDEVEIKRSVADFKADFKKSHWQRMYESGERMRPSERKLKHESIEDGSCIANYFSFLVPHCIVDKIDVPAHCGIYTIVPMHYGSGWAWSIVEDRRPKLLHRNKLSDKLRHEASGKMSHRYWDAYTTRVWNTHNNIAT